MRIDAFKLGLLLPLLALAGCAEPPETWTPLPTEPPPVDAETFAASLNLSVERHPTLWKLKDGANEIRLHPGLTLVWMNGQYLHAREPIALADGVPVVPGLIAREIQLRLGRTAAAAVRKPQPGKGLSIVLDAGHGGDNIGGIGLKGTEEKQVVLDITLAAARILQEAGAKVRLTRDRDVFVPLRERAELANDTQSDLFVSIHANVKHPGAANLEGVEVYYPTESFRIQAARDLNPSPTRAHIARSTHESLELARGVHDRLVDLLQARSNGVRQHWDRLAVLRYTRCPAILVEVGYLTDAAEEMRLANPQYRKIAAGAIAEGILAYWAKHRDHFSDLSKP